MSDTLRTRKRDLREPKSVWADSPHSTVVTSKKCTDTEVDVIIVGGGISGALVAEALANDRRSILLIDRRQPILGSTVASTAMIQHEIDEPLHVLAKAMGAADAGRAWRRSVRAVDDLSAKVEALGIVCGYERKKALYLAGDKLSARGLQRELSARDKAGIAASFVDGDSLRESFGIDREAALESPASASCNPAQLTAGLLRAARRRGLSILEGVEVTDCREFGGEVAVALSTGKILSAQHVVFCTGYEFLEAVSDKRHSITSTWAIATKPRAPLPHWLRDYLVWEASDPYLYFRSSWDGRLIAGGEDEDDPDAYHSPAKLRSKAKVIAKKISSLLGAKIGPIEFSWAAGFGVTPTGLPYIDKVPGKELIYAVMGFGGNGITFSQIASDLVVAAIAGKSDADQDLFSLRVTLKDLQRG